MVALSTKPAFWAEDGGSSTRKVITIRLVQDERGWLRLAV